jgi:hypothetical protein
VVVLELGQVVDVLVDDDVQVVGLVMRLDVAGCEGFRHDGGARRGISLSRSIMAGKQRKKAERIVAAANTVFSLGQAREHRKQEKGRGRGPAEDYKGRIAARSREISIHLGRCFVEQRHSHV